MADFLHNLVARSLDPAPGIHPRQASIFEPAKLEMALERPMLDDKLFDAPEAPQPSPEPLRATRQLAPASRAQAAVPGAIKLAQAGEPPDVAPRPDGIAPVTTVVPLPAPAPHPAALPPASVPETRRPVHAARSLEPAPTSPAAPAAPASEPARHPVEPRATQPARPAPEAPSRPARAALYPEAVEAPGAAPRVLIERIVERVAQPAGRQPRPATVASQALPQPRPGPDLARGEPAPAVPAINVTIGRIEVRATTPQAPAKPPRGAPEVMSLDEYLRRRSGGGTR